MSNAELIVAGIGLLLTIAPIVFLGGRWVGGVNQRLDQQGALLEHHGALLEHHGALLREILNDVKTLFRRVATDTVATNSPLQLTALGERVAEAVDARSWADQMAHLLLDRVSGMRPDQIHEFCFDYVYDFEPDPGLAKGISVAAYENGIDKTAVLDALAVVLRDELISRAT